MYTVETATPKDADWHYYFNVTIRLNENLSGYISEAFNYAATMLDYTQERNLNATTKGILYLDYFYAREMIELLEYAVDYLGCAFDPDPNAMSRGNAGHALNTLLWAAQTQPNAIFKVTKV